MFKGNLPVRIKEFKGFLIFTLKLCKKVGSFTKKRRFTDSLQGFMGFEEFKALVRVYDVTHQKVRKKKASITCKRTCMSGVICYGSLLPSSVSALFLVRLGHGGPYIYIYVHTYIHATQINKQS